jgi:hypothetical protein
MTTMNGRYDDDDDDDAGLGQREGTEGRRG